MRTREIERQQWPLFLGDFARAHHGHHVNVETVRQPHTDVSPRWTDLPLVGIVGADPAASEESIEIIAGDRPESPAVHIVAHPSRVVIAEQENGQSIALQIDSADGPVTVLRFEPSRENMPVGFLVT